MLCLNLCEIHPQLILSEDTFDGLIFAVEQNQKKKIERVSIGSSFCSQFFLKAPCIDELISYIDCRGWPITLTVPIFSQKDLSKGKEKILQLCRTWRERVDEVTCNDVGMLGWLENNIPQRINMGQLFFKDPRDCRYDSYQTGSRSLLRATFPIAKFVSGVELSPVAAGINLSGSTFENRPVALHQPYCYITTGQICKFASIDSNIEQKFRPNSICTLSCASVCEKTYFDEKADHYLLRAGRTVYFKQYSRVLKYNGHVRVLYWPFDELVQLRGLKNEDTYTA